MFMRKVCVVSVAVCALCLWAVAARADVFSIDATSPTASFLEIGDNAPAFPPDAVLGAGPHIHLPSPFGPGNDVNALSSGQDSVDGSDVIYFSVDRNSVGLSSDFVPSGNPTADTMNVYHQALLGQQAGDVYVTVNTANTYAQPSGLNRLHADDQNFGLVPNNWFFQPNSLDGLQDNLDAYSMEEFDRVGGDGQPDVPVFFSLAAGSPALAANNYSAADVLIYNPFIDTFDVALSEQLLLGPNAGGNDLDALALNIVVDENLNPVREEAYFSLAPGSPILAANGWSAADIFHFVATISDMEIVGGNTQLWYSHDQLGLAFEDNVDALETNAAVVPEPATLAMLALGGLGAMRRRRR